MRSNGAAAGMATGFSSSKTDRVDAASRSHLLNDQYMERFYQQLDSCSLGQEPLEAKDRAPVVRPNRGAIPAFRRIPAPTASQQSRGSTGSVGSCSGAGSSSTPNASWWAGTADVSGATIPLAARNILCASVDWEREEAVFGSADHAIYTLDLQTRRPGRQMYSKRYGHTEWVTAVQHLLVSGQVVSGGMDGKLCLWDRGRAACADLAGHGGSVSQIELAGPDRYLSASYDKTLVLWREAGCMKPQQLQRLTGHRAPVLQLCTHVDSTGAASGDRGGGLIVWDLVAGRARHSVPKAHHDHVTALAWQGGEALGPTMLLSGGQDGALRLWDCRVPDNKGPAAEAAEAHVAAGGRGAVSGIAPPANDGLAATAGADGAVKAFDCRQGLRQVWAAALPEFPYSTAGLGGLLLVGCSDGLVLIFDKASGAVQFSLAAGQEAVRTIQAASNKLVIAGDDGAARIYEFP